MALWFAALMGLVQGLTEFIPISSTAHLRVLPALLGQPDPGAAYTAVIQLGTLLAVIAYFAKDLLHIPVALAREPGSFDAKLFWLLIVGTLPIAVAGLLLKKHIEGDLRSLWVIGGALVAIGIVMIFVDRYAAGRPSSRPLVDITYVDAAIVGCAQAMALVPGVSRSGSTMCALLLMGFSRTNSARFSFLLSIPAIAGAGILEARDAFRTPGPSPILPIVVGVAVAAVTGYLAIAWFIKFLGNHSMLGFGIYRIACGAALLASLGAGLLRRV